jgi:hypothetical protein
LKLERKDYFKINFPWWSIYSFSKRYFSQKKGVGAWGLNLKLDKGVKVELEVG